jgi:hypothetical protein
MKISTLVKDWANRDTGHERVKGRYWASDLNNIRKGYLKPKDFFTKKLIDERGSKNISSGIAFENMLTKIYKDMGVDVKCGEDQEKKVIKIAEGIELVVKPDFEFETYQMETKFPETYKDFDTIKESYKDQLEAEYRATGKRTFLGYFTHPFGVFPIEYYPDDKRWEEIKQMIIKFHSKL